MGLNCGLEATVVRYAGSVTLGRHAHTTGGISVVLAGVMEEEVGRRTEVGRIGSVVAKPAGIEHRNRIGQDGAILLAIKGREADDVAVTGWRWSRSGGAAALALRLARNLNAGMIADREQLLDLLAFAGEADSTQQSHLKQAWLDGIRARLDSDVNAPAVTELAAAVEVHPVYLARAFRSRFGCSLREYRRGVRVRRAANLLAGSDLTIAAIAARLDFFDQSHMCRDFRAELGVSPNGYRAVVRS